MATTSRRGGIEVDGLAETVRALGKLDKEYKREAVDIFRDQSKKVQAQSQALIGKVGRYPKAKGMIGRSATSTGAGVKLRASKYPWAYGAEYGEVVASVYGRPVGQYRMRRRTHGPFKPPTSSDMAKNTGGYMIQPTIRRLLPSIADDAGTRMTKLVDKAMRKAGVPDG